MSEPIRLPLYAPILQRDATSDKDALATNVFYDTVESTSYATKRPGISTYASGLGEGLGIYFFDDDLFIFQGVNNTTWVDVTSGNGYFVMKQYEALNDGTNYTSNKVLSSAYGRRWQGVSLPDNWRFTGIAFGDGKFVIGATYKSPLNSPPVVSDKYYYSTDGYNWVETNTVGSTLDVLYLNNKFFATGNSSVSSLPKHSTDGITWTNYTGSQGISLSTTTWNGTVYCAANTAVEGFPIAVFTSPDALTWTTQTPIAGAHGLVYGIASNTATGTMVIAEGDNKIDYSTNNGVSWTTVTLPTVSSGDECRSIKYVNSLFVVLMDSGATLTSSDGISWTFKSYVLGSASTLFRDFAYMNGQYVVTLLTSTNAYYYSTDLLTWTLGNLREAKTATIYQG